MGVPNATWAWIIRFEPLLEPLEARSLHTFAMSFGPCPPLRPLLPSPPRRYRHTLETR